MSEWVSVGFSELSRGFKFLVFGTAKAALIVECRCSRWLVDFGTIRSINLSSPTVYLLSNIVQLGRNHLGQHEDPLNWRIR